jgi:hypothetical protein
MECDVLSKRTPIAIEKHDDKNIYKKHDDIVNKVVSARHKTSIRCVSRFEQNLPKP